MSIRRWGSTTAERGGRGSIRGEGVGFSRDSLYNFPMPALLSEGACASASRRFPGIGSVPGGVSPPEFSCPWSSRNARAASRYGMT